MRKIVSHVLVVTAMLLLMTCATMARAAEPSLQTLTVTKTFDGKPFEYKIHHISETDAYRVFGLAYPSPMVTDVENNNTIPAEYYIPKGIEANAPKRTAVICLHILNGNFELVRMTCSALASRGIPAIMFKLPYYGEREQPGGRGVLLKTPKLLFESFVQGEQDVRRTIDLLCSRPEVDPNQIGITGISMGGILAPMAAANDARLKRVVMILAGGDLAYVIRHSSETKKISHVIESMSTEDRAVIERAIERVDPLNYVDKLRDRASDGKILMINGTADRVVPTIASKKLAKALGISDRVVWLEGLGHYTAMAALPRIMNTTVEFFAQDLPPDVKPIVLNKKQRGPIQAVVSVLSQINSFYLVEPKPNRCHFVDLTVTLTTQEGKKNTVHLQLIRGANHRFRIQAILPGPLADVGRVALGRCDYPWISAEEKCTFRGTKNPLAKNCESLAFADKQYLLNLQMGSSLITGLTFSPTVLEQLLSATETVVDDRRTIQMTEKKRGSLCLTLKKDGQTPHKLTGNISDQNVAISFNTWRLNTAAHDTMFTPPAETPAQDVDQQDIYRYFGAVFNYTMEMMK